jgi:transposase
MEKIKTKKGEIVNGKTLIATVDLGKVTNTGYWRCPDGTDIKPFTFFNNGWGFNKFWSCISKAMKAKNLEEVVVGFESTGPYGEPLIHYLRKRPVKLVQVNPMHTKKLKELQGNSPNKSDTKDPRVIANIIQLGHALSLVVPEGIPAQLRRLTHARERGIGRRTALLNQLHDLVFLLFPEFLQVMKGVKTKSAQYLLRYHPTPQDIVKYGQEPLAVSLKRISRGRLGEQRAQALYESARGSVGLKEGQESILFEIRNILAILEVSDRFIAEVEKEMRNYLRQIPYSKFIISLKGIGEITTAGLIGEVGDFRQFKTVSEITKLAGLDLFEISSGKHKGQRHISKRGRSLMRKLLYFAAINVVRKGGIFHEPYQRYLQRGMGKTKALIVIAKKLLRIIFALVRDHSNYIHGYTKTDLSLKEVA